MEGYFKIPLNNFLEGTCLSVGFTIKSLKCPIFFLIKENWTCTMTRHHAESNINIILIRNFLTDSGVRQ